ncbi:MAG: hypothetical protein A2W26_06020 [Acidobacteria bacterium RBG_16_64_8]|nr:MAG: hypothetical protein A2W26_06020 [Acidobacteria bacterium RBG_16_64_8]
MATPRILPDSGVFLDGILSPWSTSRGILILARCSVFKVLFAEYVRCEVERNLLELLARDSRLGSESMDAYAKLVRLLRPKIIALPAREEVDAVRHLIRHQADVPVLASALAMRPDYLVTANTRHFTAEVAHRTALKIVTPAQLIARITIVG